MLLVGYTKLLDFISHFPGMLYCYLLLLSQNRGFGKQSSSTSGFYRWDRDSVTTSFSTHAKVPSQLQFKAWTSRRAESLLQILNSKYCNGQQHVSMLGLFLWHPPVQLALRFFVCLLTRGSLPIVPWIYISFALSSLGSWNFLHTVNLRNTQFRIKCKVHFPLTDCQVMMVPVPQLLKIVVVEHIEGIIPTRKFLKKKILVLIHSPSQWRIP